MIELEVIVINVKDYDEFDQIVSVYTKEYGIISLLAKGLKKMTSKNRAGCLLFSVSKMRILYREDKMSKLISAININSNQKIFEDYQKMIFASVIVEIYYKIGEFFVNNIYDELKMFLNYINEKNDLLIILASFYFKLFNSLGIYPILDKCVNCESKKIVHFSIDEGGFVCEDCLNLFINEKKALPEVLKSIYNLANIKIEELNAINFKEEIIKEIIDLEIKYLNKHLDIHFNSYKLIKEYL